MVESITKTAERIIPEKIESKEELVENPPDDWLQPKVFKGTSIS